MFKAFWICWDGHLIVLVKDYTMYYVVHFYSIVEMSIHYRLVFEILDRIIFKCFLMARSACCVIVCNLDKMVFSLVC
jgi:hypothetical protein